MNFLGWLLRKGSDQKRTFFNRRFGKSSAPKRIKSMKPWQARQLVASLSDAHEKSLATRQRTRQAFRLIAQENVNKQWGPEPRAARRKIARALAKTAFREHMKAA